MLRLLRCVLLLCIVHFSLSQFTTLDPIIISNIQPSISYFLYFSSFPSSLHLETYSNMSQIFISLPDTQYILQTPVTIYLSSNQSVTFSSSNTQISSTFSSSQEDGIFKLVYSSSESPFSNIIFQNIHATFLAQPLLFFSTVTISLPIPLSIQFFNSSLSHSHSLFQFSKSAKLQFSNFSLQQVRLQNNSQPQVITSAFQVNFSTIFCLEYSTSIFDISQVNTVLLSDSIFVNNSNFQTLSSLVTISRVTQFEMSDCQFLNNQGYVATILTIEWSTNILLKNSQFANNVALHSGAVMNLRGLTAFVTSQCEIISCQFINNQAMNGGVMIVEQSSVIHLHKSQFVNNSVSRHGGVVYSSHGMDTLQVTDCIFDKNRAQGNGGVFYLVNAKRVTIQLSTFTQNSAVINGGALFAMTTTLPLQLSLSTCQFVNNQALQMGGDGMVDNSLLTIPHLLTTTVVMSNCQSNSSQALTGGSFYFSFVSQFVMNNCSVNNHATKTNGTYVFQSVDQIQILNSQFVNNQVSQFGGVFFLDGSIASQLFQLSNCSFVSNRAQFGGVVAVPNHDMTIANVIVDNCVEAYNTAQSGGLVFSNEKASFPKLSSNTSMDDHGYVQVTYPVSYQVQWMSTENVTLQPNALYASQSFALQIQFFDKYQQVVYNYLNDELSLITDGLLNYTLTSDYQLLYETKQGNIKILNLQLQDVTVNQLSSLILLKWKQSPLQVQLPFTILPCPYNQFYSLIPNFVESNRYSCVPATCQYSSTAQQSTVENSLFITCLIVSIIYIFVIGIMSTKYTFTRQQQWITLDMVLIILECIKLACCIAAVIVQFMNLPRVILYTITFLQLLTSQVYTCAVVPLLWRAATCHLAKKQRIVYNCTWSSLIYWLGVIGWIVFLSCIQFILFVIQLVNPELFLMQSIAMLSCFATGIPICAITVLYYVLQCIFRKHCKEWDESNWNIVLNGFKLICIPLYLIWCCQLDSLLWILYYSITCPFITLTSVIMIWCMTKWLQIVAQTHVLPAVANYQYMKTVKQKKKKHVEFVNNPNNQLSRIFDKNDKCYYLLHTVTLQQELETNDKFCNMWNGKVITKSNDQSVKQICIQQFEKTLLQTHLRDICLELSDVMNRNFKYVTPCYGLAETESSILLLTSEWELTYHLAEHEKVTSVYDLLVSKAPLSFIDKIKIMYQIAQGLQELHLRSFAHRCLTCADVLYVKAVDKYVIAHIGQGKWEDALLTKQLMQSRQLTWINRFPNRLLYMAPEVYRNLIHQSMHHSTFQQSYELIDDNIDSTLVDMSPSLIQSLLQHQHQQQTYSSTPMTYDEQVDIWSFGVILFCLMHDTVAPFDLQQYWNHIFQHQSNTSKFFSLVVNHPKNRELQEQLQQNNNGWVMELMKQCFSMDAYDRPTIDSILQLLKTELARSK